MANKASDKTPESVPALKVTSRPDSFCRAGRRWTKEPQTVPLSDFKPEHVESLKAEPNLVVEETTLAPAEAE